MQQDGYYRMDIIFIDVIRRLLFLFPIRWEERAEDFALLVNGCMIFRANG